MFVKLLKHEWKASAKLLIILSCCMLGVAVLMGFDIQALDSMITQSYAATDATDTMMSVPVILFAAFGYLAFILYLVGVPIILLNRFYKSRFTDEGYLTFTLPAKPSQLFLSAAVNMLIWLAIMAVVVFLSLMIIGLILFLCGGGAASDVSTDSESISLLQTIFGDVPATTYWVVIPVNIIYSIVVPMSAVVIGAVMAKKRKVLAIIGILYGTSLLSSLLNSMISSVVSVMTMQNGMELAAANQDMTLLWAVTPAILIVCGYTLSIYLMKNKLNLP